MVIINKEIDFLKVCKKVLWGEFIVPLFQGKRGVMLIAFGFTPRFSR
jgi:hypothetical protein